jgi:hypothetical protein
VKWENRNRAADDSPLDAILRARRLKSHAQDGTAIAATKADDDRRDS